MKTARLFLMGAALAMVCAAQERFDTPEAAAQAVIEAAGNHDAARLAAIFGPNAKDVLTSSNPTQDRAEQTEFARMAQAKHRLERPAQNPNRAVLSIGDADWPFPVPLVRKDGKWFFDASETKTEMHARRIGTDELDAIEICYGYVDAQRKFASEGHDSGDLQPFALRAISGAGQHDGLYWEGSGQPLVPHAFAMAVWSGAEKGPAKPYHGYYFRILTAQGADAPGGAHNFVVKGKLMGGFGLVAWPAEYGVSGIHTFIVNQSGEVYQKDIEPVPGKPAAPVTSYDPDRTWQPVE